MAADKISSLSDWQKSFIKSACINGERQGAQMKLLSYVILTALLMSVGTPLVGAGERTDTWGEPVAEGIEYREYNLPDPNNVFVTRMERNNPQVTIESSIAQGRLSGGTETVSGMAQRYDGAINYWDQTWGNTNKVTVAINGYYFNYGSGIPYQGQVHSGWYSKLFDPCESGTGGSGFGWNLNREAFIGESVRTAVREIHYLMSSESDEFPADTKKSVVENYTNLVFLPIISNFIVDLPEPKQVFDGINVKRGEDQLILYTSQYGRDTGTGKTDSVEVLVRMTSPSLIKDVKDEDFLPKGVIERVYENKGSIPIPFDHVVLSMHGIKKDEFLATGAKPGDEIKILQIIRECNNSPRYKWENTYASIGGAFYFLRDGVIQDFSNYPQAKVRDPRTAIAYNADYIFFIVVDGRNDWFSKGMTIRELAEFAKSELGATHGIAEDGGGSSTMVVNGEVKNNTYCNITVCKGKIFLPIVSKSGQDIQSDLVDPRLEIFPSLPASGPLPPEQLSGDGLPLTEEYYTYAPDATGDILQRLVANGMMMVVVQPKDQPSEPIFAVDDQIKTLTQVDVLLGPGTNYGVVATVDPNTTGKILGNDNGLNGAWAKGYYWWRVLLDAPGGVDIVGWVKEPTLTLGAKIQ